MRWISSMNSTSCSTRFDSIAARSPARSSAGPGGDPQRGAQLGGDDHRQRRLAQARRAGQQDVIRCAATVLGSLEDQLQLFANPGLADELARASAAAGWRRCRPRRRSAPPKPPGRRCLRIPRPRSGPSLLTQHRQRRRSALVVLASGSLASTLSVASSACLTAKPSPTSASTTGPAPHGRSRTTAPDGGHGTHLVTQAQRHALGGFLPTFGTRVNAVMSPSAIARRSVGPSYTANAPRAMLGPMPDTASSVRNRSRASASEEAVQRHRILAHDHRRDQPGLAAAVQRRQGRSGSP